MSFFFLPSKCIDELAGECENTDQINEVDSWPQSRTRHGFEENFLSDPVYHCAQWLLPGSCAEPNTDKHTSEHHIFSL